MATLILTVILLLHCNWTLCDNITYSNDASYMARVLHGRCITRCYDKYCKSSSKSAQDTMYNIYDTNDCTTPASLECKKACNLTNIFSRSCDDICLTSGIVCQNSCLNLRKVVNETTNLNNTGPTISTPTLTCQQKSDGSSVTVYINWSVDDNVTANVVFVVSILRGKTTTKWKTLGQISRSLVPIHGLWFNTDYKFRVTAVNRYGIIQTPKETSWIRTIPSNSTGRNLSNLKIEGQKIHNGKISALVTWKVEKDPPCFYTLHWMTSNPQHAHYDRDELKAPSYLRYWVNNLHFESNYTLHLSSYDGSNLKSDSSEIVTWFVTDNCHSATNYNYSICAPGEPRNVTASVILRPDNTSACSVNITWLPPYLSDNASGITYLVRWYKIIPIYMSKFIEPHQGEFLVNGTPWVELNDIHRDYNYSISVQTLSKAGRSKDVVLMVTKESCPSATDSPVSLITEKDNKILLIIGGVAGFTIIALVLSIGIMFRSRHKRKKLYNTLNGRTEELNPLYQHGTDYVTNLVEDTSCEIEFSSLALLDVLGEGAFGKVYKAVFKSSPKEDHVVAVKMLKDCYDVHEKKSLLMEIEFMRQLGNHPHIVSFVGCCKKDNICLIMDYCKLGDLRTFLLRYRQTLQKDDFGQLRLESGTDSGVPSSAESASSFKTTVPELKQSRLLSYARQIALAMEYMASRKFVHRDLAARNILMFDEERLKISDFGLTRDIYERNLYQPTSARRLPYKWMALEAIFDQVFTIKSDVWSFGIVLWEIVTLGGSPYPGIPNKDLFNLLKEGYRMEKPENCTMDVYQLMLSAWHPNPHCRPSFTELRKKLEHMLEQTKPYINLSVSVSKDYYDSTSLSDQSDRNLHKNDHVTYVEMSTKDTPVKYESPQNTVLNNCQ